MYQFVSVEQLTVQSSILVAHTRPIWV